MQPRISLGYPHTYSRLSWDQGVTWGSPTMLRYEAGDEFDPNNPLAPGYLTANQGYFGSSIIKLSNGNILAVLGEANSVDGSHNSSLCMIGTWSASTKDYQWTAGSRTTISPTLSSMGLDEPDVAQLKDGRVLVVWRGLKTATNPGRKFCGISTDGGMTLGPVAELTYWFWQWWRWSVAAGREGASEMRHGRAERSSGMYRPVCARLFIVSQSW
jgi:hypothetical protein